MGLPLFPLPNFVLLPEIQVPLYIFEPRYRELLARVQKSGEPFGIVRLLPKDRAQGDERITRVGSLAHLIGVTQHEDGTSSIVIRGGERFQIQSIDKESHQYLSAEYQVLPLTIGDLDVDHMTPSKEHFAPCTYAPEALRLASLAALELKLNGDQMQRFLEARSLKDRWDLIQTYSAPSFRSFSLNLKRILN